MPRTVSINKILFISLSNIGDVILTLPCLDFLRNNFPNAKISVLVGPHPETLLKGNPYIDKLIIYDKKIAWYEKRDLVRSLKKEHYDLIIDLRNSMFPFLIGSKYKYFTRKPPNFLHMKARHLYKIKNQIMGYVIPAEAGIHKDRFPIKAFGNDNKCLYISQDDKNYIENLLVQNKINSLDKIVLIGPGAMSHIKRYPKEGFVKICQALIKDAAIKIILVGDEEDYKVAAKISEEVKTNIFNLCAKTTLLQLAYLIEKSALLISCDSAIMHLASYLNKPIVAIFGPTNEVKYGPWSDKSIAIRENLKCAPCEVALCKYNHECMKALDPEKIIQAARKLLYASLIA